MATYPGDPRARPELAVCAISATGSIKRKRESIIGRTAVCLLSSNSRDSRPHHIVDALNEQLRISRHEVRVIKHYPEQYLVFFNDSRAYHRAVSYRHGVRNRGRTFNFEPWTERRNAVEKQLEFRVRLRIEGMPPHAWSEEVAAKVIGQHCAIHYVEGPSRRQDCTRTYDLWAWSANPSKIPKKVLLTITDPDREIVTDEDMELYHDPPRGFKGAFDYKLHIHLDVVEDLSFFAGKGGGDGHNRKPRREFLWNYGAPDSFGERRSGQGHDNRTGRDYHPRQDRDDYDDNFNRGVRHHMSQSSWGRMTRCREAAVDDCYSAARFRGNDHGHRSRAMAPTGRQTTWCKKAGTGKRVTFANPLFQIMGEYTAQDDHFLIQSATVLASSNRVEWSDPMREELFITSCFASHPSREERIREMLAAAPRWAPVASPTCQGETVPPAEEGLQYDPNENVHVCSTQTIHSSLATPSCGLEELNSKDNPSCTEPTEITELQEVLEMPESRDITEHPTPFVIPQQFIETAQQAVACETSIPEHTKHMSNNGGFDNIVQTQLLPPSQEVTQQIANEPLNNGWNRQSASRHDL
ncbi:unnamed protein product [Urochloa humidicola]